MRNVGRNLIIVLSVVFLWACAKEKEYPIEPIIKMSDRQEYQNPSQIIISFTDGDGDIGLDQGDTMPPYNLDTVNFNKFYYNVLLYYFEKNDDEWEEVETLVPWFYRVPNITPSGQNKALNGEIEVNISLPANRPDSIRMEIELIDRALHISNRLVTPTIYR